MTIHEINNAVLAAMAVNGIIPTQRLTLDGLLHRAHCEKDKPGSLNLAYVIHTDGKPNAWYQHFSTGITGRWTASGRREPMTAEMRQQTGAAKREQEAEQKAKHLKAAKTSAYIRAKAAPITDPSQHHYLPLKRIQPHGIKLWCDALVIPLYDEAGTLCNLQFIAANGDKRFLGGGKKKGCYFTIGDITDKLLVCEGFATGASLHEATGEAVIVAFDAGNLIEVAKVIRRKYPNAEIIIAGDNDTSGVGQKAANDAALACKGKVLIPKIIGYDWNDILSGMVSA